MLAEGLLFIRIEQVRLSLNLTIPQTLMILIPFLSTHITELISAPASHMITTLVLLNYEFALFALSVMEVLLEKFQLLALALALVRL